MRGARNWGFPLGVASLVLCILSACGTPGAGRHPSTTEPAIALSVTAKDIYLVDPATGHRRDLVSGLPNYRAGYAVWSPDRQDLAYARDGIVVLDMTSHRATTIVRAPQLSMPAWDPQGTHLAYSDGLSIWVTSLGRVAPKRIHVPAILGPVDLSWSSTGAIAFEGVNLDCSMAVRCVSTGSSEIWTINPDDRDLVRITHVRHAESPKWSPDGTQLLFVRRHPSTGDDGQLWVCDPSGSGAHRLATAPGVVAADWSPDGSNLAVVTRGTSPGTLQLWIGRADGSGLKPMGSPVPGTDASIDW